MDALLTSPWILPCHESAPGLVDRLIPVAEHREFPVGATLIEQGEYATGIYFLLDGHVKQTVMNPNGTVRALAMIAPGCVIGEAAVLDGEPSQITTTALTRLKCLFLRTEQVHDLIETDPDFVRLLLLTLTRRFRLLSKLVTDTTLRPVPEQLTCLLHQLARQKGPEQKGLRHVTLQVSHQELAEFLGVSRVTISNCLANLKEEGLIETGHRLIHVLEPSRLRCCGESPWCISYQPPARG